MSGEMLFFPGIHQPGDAQHFELACISVNRLGTRRKPVPCGKVLGDSGAFTKVSKFGGYPESPEVYAGKVHRLQSAGVVAYVAVVSEDYMCEPFVLAKTGLTIPDHQRLTIERYDALRAELVRLYGGEPPFEIMPVLQGFAVEDYLRHIEQYGDRLTPGMWVGVGSVCKRQGDVSVIEDLLQAIKEVRPDFRREADGAPESARAPVALQRRQHGVEFQRQEAGPQRERLARGPGIRSSRDAAAQGGGAAPTVGRAMRVAA